MKREEIIAVRFTADEGCLFVNKTTKIQKKVLVFQNEKWFEDYEEVTFEEAVKLQDEWDKQKYEYLKILYK